MSANHKADTLQQLNKKDDDAPTPEERPEPSQSDKKNIYDRLVQKFNQLASHHNDIHVLLDHYKAEIEKEDQKANEGKTSPDESTAEGRPELSLLDQKILEDPAMKKFEVTYNYLPESCLRFCLIFLSIFPENAVIRKRPLIYWWIGEGLISNEEKGEKIFEELLKHEFIIPHGNGKNPLVSKCTIHPWVRYFLISLAKTAGLLRLDSKGVPRFDIISSRRACLLSHDESLSQLKERNSDDNLRNLSGKDYKDLRSIFNVNERYISFGLKQLANLEKRKLKVLQLGRWQDLPTHHIEVVNEAFLKDLWTQKHLKYLSLRGISRITALPDSVVELSNLEILDLKACHNLETLPKDISALKKLTHLDVSECYLLESMPLGIDKLTSLEVLKGFVIGNSKKTPCRIRDLGKLEKLKRLSIHIGSEAMVQEGEFQMLKDLKSVWRLKISWGVVSEEHTKKVVKESFSFPPSLDKLDFEGFPYTVLPEWLVPSNLRNLKKLYIKGGKLKRLKVGGNDDASMKAGGNDDASWKVEILRLHHLDDLEFKMEDSETKMKALKRFFPSLRYAHIMNKKKNLNEEKKF